MGEVEASYGRGGAGVNAGIASPWPSPNCLQAAPIAFRVTRITIRATRIRKQGVRISIQAARIRIRVTRNAIRAVRITIQATRIRKQGVRISIRATRIRIRVTCIEIRGAWGEMPGGRRAIIVSATPFRAVRKTPEATGGGRRGRPLATEPASGLLHPVPSENAADLLGRPASRGLEELGEGQRGAAERYYTRVS